MANLTKTENGENAFNTTGNKCLDLFSTINRETTINDLYSKFVNAWNEDPETCLKIMYNFRDIRSGKGEKRISHAMMCIIKNQKKEIYKSILEPFVNLGYWKDLLHLVEMSVDNDYDAEVMLFSKMLKIDSVADKPSLCAKWAPSENSHYDKSPINMTSRIQKDMKLSPRDYRKLLSSLRKKIHIIESDLSQKKYQDITFEQIPSKAHLNYREALKRNENSSGKTDDERIKLALRYNEYLTSLSTGEKKVNFTGLMPHEIISHLNRYTDNSLLEGQWKALSQDTEKLGIFDKCLCVVDVSGSMSGQPMEVAVALGALISECAKGIFANKVITFSEQPTFVDLTDSKNLFEKIEKIKSGDWGANTNIEAVFMQILNMGKFFGVSKDQMPEKLFIFTDMQFDQVSGHSTGIYKTLDKLKDTYKNHGYELPQIVCWNLRTIGSVPCETNDDGIILLSGFSVALLKCVMESKDIKFTPISIIDSIKEKYKIQDGLIYGKMVINNEEINKIKFK